MAHGTLMEFTDSTFSNDVLQSDLPVVVDFWAEWCGPCKMLTPIFEALSVEFEGKIRMGKVNVDDNPQIAAKYGIVSIPSLLFFNRGTIAEQHTGLMAQAALKAKINKVFKL
ncbi:MAG: thioredoxin [Chitinispirillaceae bacterium]|nr:thioredoxin [Chitinispirillaceae bacterium]